MMSRHHYSHTSPNFDGGSAGCCWGRRARAPWSPFELTAMILGFMIFWPIGLAILCAKIWQRKFGHEGDLFAFMREQGERLRENFVGVANEGASDAWRGPGFMRSSGNVAFDEWRERELARLEEERRKLAEAEREFAEHIDELRRARDRAEFDAFMRARKSNGGAGDSGRGDAPSA
jgi:hypothetical protein